MTSTSAVPRVDYDKLSDQRYGEPSSRCHPSPRVEAAREIQRRRFEAGEESPAGVLCNADMRNADIRKYCALDTECQNLLRAAVQQLQLSARAYHRVLKLARTIADLASSEDIRNTHLAEALQYRPQVMI